MQGTGRRRRDGSCAGIAATLDFDGLLRYLAARAVPGVEEVRDGAYRRVLRLPHGLAIVELVAADPERTEDATWAGRADERRTETARARKAPPAPVAARVDQAPTHTPPAPVAARVHLADERDRPEAERSWRTIVDADADPDAILATLGGDPLIGRYVRANPGLRVPGGPDPHELAVRAVLGQQVSIAAARTLAGRLAHSHGEPVTDPAGTLTHAFPTAAALAAVDPAELAMPRSRATALLGLATALATGALKLTPDTDPDEADAALQQLRGIGPWTAAYVRMRALGDRDVFLPTDLGVRRALESLGHPGDPRSATSIAEAWRPWRSYALMHLWGRLTPPPGRAGVAP